MEAKMDKKYVRVYNTITHQYEMVEVTPEVYKEYMRGQWKIENNDKSFFEHQIQFSAIIGHANIENFKEFLHLTKDTSEIVEDRLLVKALYQALDELPQNELQLVYEIYFQDWTERRCAKKREISQKNINKKKKEILSKLHKLIENFMI